MPDDEQSKLTSETKSLIASTNFLKREPWLSLASNMVIL